MGDESDLRPSSARHLHRAPEGGGSSASRFSGPVVQLVVVALAVVSLVASSVFFADATREVRLARAAALQAEVIRAEGAVVAATSRVRASAVLEMTTGGGTARLGDDVDALERVIGEASRSLDDTLAESGSPAEGESASGAREMAEALRRLADRDWEVPPVRHALEASDDAFRETFDVLVAPAEGRWAELFQLVYHLQWAKAYPLDHFEVLVAHQMNGRIDSADTLLESLSQAHTASLRQIAIEIGEGDEPEGWFEDVLDGDALARYEPALGETVLALERHEELLRMDAEYAALLRDERDVLATERIESRYAALDRFHATLEAVADEALATFEARVIATVRRESRRRVAAAAGAVVTVVLVVWSLVWTGSNRRRQADGLRRLAEVDSLTGLSNRFALHTYEPERLADTEEGGVALLQIDVDRFKSINDEYGHAAGDAVLVAFAARLRHVVRSESDTVARIGGDEFVVVLHGLDEPDREAAELVDRIERQLADPIDCGDFTVRVGASIGTATSSAPIDLESLLSQADLGVYRAKTSRRRGGSRAIDTTFDGIADDVIAALTADRFELRLLPQIDRRSGRMVGVDLLVTLQMDDRGWSEPELVLDVIEWLGKGRRLLEQTTVRQLAEVHQRIGDLFEGRLWVRIPGATLVGAASADRLLDRIEAAGVPLSRLGLEIGESLPERSREGVFAALARAVERSVELSVADFGRTTAPLRLLDQLPLARVRLDPSVTATLGDGSPALAEGVRSYCELRGARLVAAGVLADEAAEGIDGLGIRYVQGAWPGASLSIDDLERALRETLVEAR